MLQIKENLKVQFSGLILAVQDGIFSVKQRYYALPKWERSILVLLIILIIPGFFLIRYGGEFYFTKLYSRGSLAAHPAFNSPEPLEVGSVKIIQNPNGAATAYATIVNPNLDLALESLRYTFHFLNSSNEEVTSTKGETYLLPNQKKWVVISKVSSLQSVSKATLELEQPNWQKRLDLPEVNLKMSEPYIYEEVNPLATSAEGAVVNNSEYDLSHVSLLLVLYGRNEKVLAVTTREEFSMKAFERRAYKLQWPGIYKEDVVRVDLQAYTNTLDPENISAGITE